MRLKNVNITLSTNDALILQQIHEDGEDDIANLSKKLGMRRGQVAQSLKSLKRKGLVTTLAFYDGMWVQLSSYGRHLMNYIWPEARSMPLAA